MFMVEISSAQTKQLAALRLLRPARDLTLQGFTEHDLLLHNIFKYAPDDEAVLFLDAPEEWLVTLYSGAVSYGARFRDVEKMLQLLGSLKEDDPRVALYRRASQSFNSSLELSASRVKALQILRQTLLPDERWKVFKESKEAIHASNLFNNDSAQRYVVNAMLALIARDYITETGFFRITDYYRLTLPWRKVFGKLVESDEEIAPDKTARHRNPTFDEMGYSNG